MKSQARVTYEVEAARSGSWWALRVPAIPGVHSQVRRLADAGDMIREAIAMGLEVSEDSFDLRITTNVNEAANLAAIRARAAREDAELAQADAFEALREAVVAARDAGVPVRDIAEELDVSFQYVAKVAQTPQRTRRPRRPGTSMELYKTPDDQYMWRLKSADGSIIATAGEPFPTREAAMAAAAAVSAAARSAAVRVS